MRNPAMAITQVGRSISSKSLQSQAHTMGKMIQRSHRSAIATTGEARRWFTCTSTNDRTIGRTMMYLDYMIGRLAKLPSASGRQREGARHRPGKDGKTRSCRAVANVGFRRHKVQRE